MIDHMIFTDIAIKEMLNSTDVQESDKIIIESDNCTTQYKSASHFLKLQQLSDIFCKPIIRIWSIVGHGKGEVDHVGGIAKVNIRLDIASGMFFAKADDMVTRLSKKYEEKQDPLYIVKNITSERLMAARLEDKHKYHTIGGSHAFQVVVFHPNSDFFKAAPYLCICKECKAEYGLCTLFKAYYHQIQKLNKTLLRSEMLP